MPEKILLKVGDVARVLKCRTGHAYSLIRSGALPAVFVGRRAVRVDSEVLAAFIEHGGTRAAHLDPCGCIPVSE